MMYVRGLQATNCRASGRPLDAFEDGEARALVVDDHRGYLRGKSVTAVGI